MSIDHAHDKVLEFRGEVLRLYLRIAALAAVVVLPLYYFLGIAALTLGSSLYFMGVLALAWACRRGAISVLVASRLFLGATVAVCMLGLWLGNETYDNKPWQILIVVAAFGLLGAREGLRWALGCLLGILAIAALRRGAYEPVSLLVLLSAQVTATAALYFFARQHERDLRTIAQMSHTDSLTQTYNRQLFEELAVNAFNRSRRSEEPLALFMIDIDYFKRFNDHYGHIAGDRALSAVAEVIRHSARRATDLVFRYGGEEFCVISSGLDAGGARQLAESIVDGVRALQMSHAAAERGLLTVSIGVAHHEYLDELSVHGVLEQADAALYRAKTGGRDRVEHHDDDPHVIEDYVASAAG